MLEPLVCKRLVGNGGDVHYVIYRKTAEDHTIAVIPGYEMESLTQQYKEEERIAKANKEKRR